MLLFKLIKMYSWYIKNILFCLSIFFWGGINTAFAQSGPLGPRIYKDYSNMYDGLTPSWAIPARVGIPPLPAPAASLPDAKYKIVVPDFSVPKVITPPPFYASQITSVPKFTNSNIVRSEIQSEKVYLIVHPNKHRPNEWDKNRTYGWGVKNLLYQNVYDYKQVLKDGEPLIEHGMPVYQRFEKPSYGKPRAPAQDGFWVRFFDPEF